MLCLYIELVGWNTKLIVYRMTSLVAAVLGRRFETSLRGLVALSKIQLQQSLRSRCHYLPWLRPSRNVLPRTKPFTPTFSSAEVSEKLMLFSEQSHDHDSSSGSSGGGQQKSGPLKLMDYKKLRWPNPINVLRNYIFAALIRISFDQEFSMSSFLAGAEQVICHSNHNFLKLVMLKNTDNEDNVDTTTNIITATMTCRWRHAPVTHVRNRLIGRRLLYSWSAAYFLSLCTMKTCTMVLSLRQRCVFRACVTAACRQWRVTVIILVTPLTKLMAIKMPYSIRTRHLTE